MVKIYNEILTIYFIVSASTRCSMEQKIRCLKLQLRYYPLIVVGLLTQDWEWSPLRDVSPLSLSFCSHYHSYWSDPGDWWHRAGVVLAMGKLMSVRNWIFGLSSLKQQSQLFKTEQECHKQFYYYFAVSIHSRLLLFLFLSKILT